MSWFRKIAKYYEEMDETEKQNVLNDFISRYNIEQTPDGKIVLYHGTKSAKRIRQTGYFAKGTYFTSDPSYAAHAGDQNIRGTGKMQTMKVKIDPKLVSPGIHWIAMSDIPVEEIL